MDVSDHFKRTVFAGALELEDSGQRAEFLLLACGADVELRREVEELLQAESAAAKGFLPGAPTRAGVHWLQSQPASAPSSVPWNAGGEKPGDQIAQYTLLEQIGEGGCGVVYSAQQEEPIERTVALKIIKLGMDTQSVVARFAAEWQTLALMDHPNIAKVLDAGATQAGRPYFVMELVRGPRITEFCSQNQMPIRRRLELFMQVCQAVRHAHQKGIIHRDLKPSNVLVSVSAGVEVPKVIDFGIAKVIQGRSADQTSFTACDQLLGTPGYMSPEQADLSGRDIDTRTDIYALGVLLYELLTGHTPLDSKELLASGVNEMHRTIWEKEPIPPSTRLRTLTKARTKRPLALERLETRRLIQLVQGDLDCIVMKCLEKDRGRRYQSANELILDIQRHLAGDLVVARPPSNVYRLGKFVRRNKLTLIALGTLAVVLAGGFGLSTWLFLRERQAHQQAIAAERTQRRLRAEAEVRELNATALQFLTEGKLPDAERSRRQAIEHQKRLWGSEHPEVALSLQRLAQVLIKEGKLAEAESALRTALEMQRKFFGDQHRIVAATVSDLADILESQHKLPQAEAMHRHALAIRRQLNGGGQLDAADSLNKLAELLGREHRLADAEPMLREALEIRRALSPDDAGALARLYQNLANVVREQGRLAEVVDVYCEAVPRYFRVWPTNLDQEIGLLSDSLFEQRRYSDLERLFQSIVPPPLEHLPEMLGLVRARGGFRARRGRFQDAAADFARVVELSPERANDWYRLAALLAYTGQQTAYKEACRQSLARFAQTTDPSAAEQIAKSCLLVPKFNDQMDLVLKLADQAAQVAGHRWSSWFDLTKALADYRQDRLTTTVQWAQRTLTRSGEVFERDAAAEALLAMAYHRLHQQDDARAALAKSADLVKMRPVSPPNEDLGRDWCDWLVAWLLHREAASLMDGGLKNTTN